MASRNCCKVQAAVGWAVTLHCRMRRLPTSITTNTYSTRNPAVVAAKKSATTMPWRGCKQTSASAARMFSCRLSAQYVAASTPARFAAKPRPRTSPTVRLRCVPRPRSDSPAPCAQSPGEDFPESAVFPTATCTAKTAVKPTRCQPTRVSGLIINAFLQLKRRDHSTKEKCAAAVSLLG